MFLLLISCQKEFRIDINTEKVSGNTIKTIIKTNFPEKTILTITAERLYRMKNNSNIYGGNHFFSRIPVKNGMIEFSFAVDDGQWIREHNHYMEMDNNSNLSDTILTEIDYESIIDSLKISVFYNPLFEVDENVMKIVGENGKNLNGRGTLEIEGTKVFRVSQNIHWEFDRKTTHNSGY